MLLTLPIFNSALGDRNQFLQMSNAVVNKERHKICVRNKIAGGEKGGSEKWQENSHNNWCYISLFQNFGLIQSSFLTNISKFRYQADITYCLVSGCTMSGVVLHYLVLCRDVAERISRLQPTAAAHSSTENMHSMLYFRSI